MSNALISSSEPWEQDMAQIKGLNAHDRPPESIRQRYKKYQKTPLAEIDHDSSILDLQALDPDSLPDGISVSEWRSSEDFRLAFDQFVKGDCSVWQHRGPLFENIPVFTHRSVSGLLMIPSMFPPTVQIELLSRLFHRDLSNNEHQTNVHLHYDVTYPDQAQNTEIPDGPASSSSGQTRNQFPSFFADDPTRTIHPNDPGTHKPITVQNLLEKKLRWVTLGGQYDWTAKVYPDGPPPPFPNDVAELLRAAFPETEAQAAILNVYSAGDTLSAHRDVSEECDVGLISVSFGCDGLFMISHDDGISCEIIRLRSGDAVYMNGSSRFAWHGVPKILPDTCPSWLADWPSLSHDNTDASQYALWKGWMSEKRINLNVRQMTNSMLHEALVTGH